MTIYTFPTKDKTLYGLTTGTVYKPGASEGLPWEAGGTVFNLNGIAAAEPDGVTDVRRFKVGDTISTEEELEALPDGAILRDESGAWQKDRGWFLLTGTIVLYTSADITYDNLLTIVWLPETGEQA